jgi:hypothetical protein
MARGRSSAQPASKRSRIDPHKLRVAIRRLDRHHHLMLLDRAIDMLPASALGKLVHDFFRPEELRAEGPRPSLLAQIQAFHAASLAGEFYEDFAVDSRNHMTHSRGTGTFIAEYHRLLDRLCEASARGKLSEARPGFELLFDLLRQIDEFRIDIVFFADEAGAWQIGVHWPSVFPAWAHCVAAEEPPEAFAAIVHGMIDEFARTDRAALLRIAAALASEKQAAALDRHPRRS